MTRGPLERQASLGLIPSSPSPTHQDPLVGRPDTPLRELGVCNGDLLWLLTPNVTTAAEAPEPATKRVRDADPLPQPQQAAPQQQQAAPQQQEQQQQQQEDKGKQPMVVDGEGEADAPVEQPPEPLPPSQRLPAYLLRTLEQSCSSACQPTDVALLAAHAALLETGFVPCWAADLLGSGAGADSSSVYQLPASCWVSASVCRVQYRLAPTNGNGSSAMEAEPAEPTAVAAGEQEQQPMQEGEQEEVEGAAAAAGPACTLQCSTLGGGAVVLAVATQAHSRHLALQATTYVQLLEAGASPAEAAAPVEAAVAGPSRSSSAAADAAAAPAASSSLVRLLPDGGLALGGCLRLGPAAAKQLWTRLKDGLAFPMLLAAYAEAGLAPPAGLLALPEELKQRVLEALGVSEQPAGWLCCGILGGGRPARIGPHHLLPPACPETASAPLPFRPSCVVLQPQDLAALSCACSELRHLASQDALWQPLFQRDFPQAGQVYAMQVGGLGRAEGGPTAGDGPGKGQVRVWMSSQVCI